MIRLALSCGEPAGIAPEITAKAWATLRHTGPVFIYIGDVDYLMQRAHAAALPLRLQKIDRATQAEEIFEGALPVLHQPLPSSPLPGKPQAETASCVISAIDQAVTWARQGNVSGLVTNPIQKETLYAAGFKYQGHTDYLASLANDGQFQHDEVMMLVAQDLRAVPLTVHVPLEAVPSLLSRELLVTKALVVLTELRRRFGIAKPRLAITGLNPHAGENGMLGTEEVTIIKPAILQLQAEGHAVIGPLPADTAFHAEARARYDAILCMYHDQALIPAKMLDFHGGVNVTLGLPFIRTSPDHGTGLDIAGKGTANPQSLIAALRLAADLAQRSGL